MYIYTACILLWDLPRYASLWRDSWRNIGAWIVPGKNSAFSRQLIPSLWHEHLSDCERVADVTFWQETLKTIFNITYSSDHNIRFGHKKVSQVCDHNFRRHFDKKTFPIRPFDMQHSCTKLKVNKPCYWITKGKQTLLANSRVCLPQVW